MKKQFFYISGCDGTGKTTQAKQLLNYLQSKKIPVKHLWLRFPFFFSAPLLAYARWRGFSWYEQEDGIRHGYWNFRGSWIMRRIFPWVLLFDALVASLCKVYLPLLMGYTVVCERYVLDMLVDQSLALDERIFHQLPGRLLINLLPANTKVVVLDLDSEIIKERRPDLKYDRRLTIRLERYHLLASMFSLPIITNAGTVVQVHNAILEQMSA